MKTSELGLVIRKFVLSGELPKWFNEKHITFRLHTSEPFTADDFAPEYTGYKPIKVDRKSIEHGSNHSTFADEIQFAANKDKGNIVKIAWYSISIGDSFMAYKIQIPDGGLTLTPGHAPYFEKGGIKVIEK